MRVSFAYDFDATITKQVYHLTNNLTGKIYIAFKCDNRARSCFHHTAAHNGDSTPQDLLLPCQVPASE